VGVRTADGRPDSLRSDSLRSGSSRPPDVPRPASRPLPLVARSDLGAAPRYVAEDRYEYGRRENDRGRRTRVRRFVHRYGWRAYAVPLLTVATLITLGDLAVHGSDSTPTTVAAKAAAPTTAAPLSDGADGDAEGDAGPSEEPSGDAAHKYVRKGDGTVSIVDGRSRVYGKGPLRRFVVEIEDGIGVDAAGFAHEVQATLADPRSWGHGGRMSFQRVGAADAAAGRYDFRVTLISPGNMELYCPGVSTGGYTSCRYGERAVINLARWATAVPDYKGDITTYRHYVVNHEVGHALGNGHQACPGRGAIAPVMQQQTLGLDGCVKNAWPYP
jgi:Protein of unknown function (DUF3152)